MTIMNDQQDYVGIDSVISAARAIGDVSPTLDLNVTKPGATDRRLPSPEITDAAGGELDLGLFPEDTTSTCAPWPLIAAGQRVWLNVDGTCDNGTATTHALLNASAVTAAQVRNGLSQSLPRTWLESLRDGSTVTVRLAVTFNGSTGNSDKIDFPITSYTLRSGGCLEDFETAPTGYIFELMDRPLCTLAPQPAGPIPAIRRDSSGGKYLSIDAVLSDPSVGRAHVFPKKPTRSIAFDYYDHRNTKEYPCSVYVWFADRTFERVLLEGRGRCRYSSNVGRVIKELVFTVKGYGTLDIDNILFRA